MLAKGTAAVTKKVISSVSTMTKNITNIIKGEVAFVAKLKNLDPKIKEALKPLSCAFADSSEIIEISQDGFKNFITKNAGKLTSLQEQQLLKKFTTWSHELKMGKGRFTLNIPATVEEAEALANGWLGKNAKYFENPKCRGFEIELQTPDYRIQRTFRFPKIKKYGRHTGKLIANYEERLYVPIIKRDEKPWVTLKNAHLKIIGK
ncbi:hypothetical protein ACFLYH_03305 [Candidatus Dependentiae bacterium]